MEHEAVHELTAAYALDALDPDEERRYEEHLAGCERCREELASFSEIAGSLALAVDPAKPPPELRGRILDTARAERPNVVPLRPRWAYPVAAVAAVAACAAIGFGLWAASLHSRLDRAQEAFHGLPLTGAAGSVVLGADGRAALVVSGLEPTPAGKTYEAWVLQDGKAYPAGLFQGGQGTIVVRLEHRVPHGAVVGVTIERAGGASSPSGQPLVASSPA